MALLLPQSIDPPQMVVSATGFLIILGIILGLGFMARNVIGKRVLEGVDAFFLGIPVIAFVYRGLKQAIESFQMNGPKRRFQRVVYVKHPVPGSRLVGFVTGDYYDSQIEKGVTSVSVPTSPNLLTGFVIIVENEHVIESKLSLEEATKLVFSAGLISPFKSASEVLNDQQSSIPSSST